jgi:hypothetical protein
MKSFSRVIALYLLTLLFYGWFCSSAFASLVEVGLIKISDIGSHDIQWIYDDYKKYGSEITWKKLVQGTSYENEVVSEDFKYKPGCVPTALAQVMTFMLRDKYPEYANEIINRTTGGRPIIDYITSPDMKPRTNLHYVNLLNDHLPFLQNQYDWSNMPDKITDDNDQSRLMISTLLRDVGVGVGVWYELYDSGQPRITVTPPQGYSPAKVMKPTFRSSDFQAVIFILMSLVRIDQTKNCTNRANYSICG